MPGAAVSADPDLGVAGPSHRIEKPYMPPRHTGWPGPCTEDCTDPVHVTPTEAVINWRLDEWDALPDVCFIAACEGADIDERGPIWLRDGSMHKACTEHWEPIMRVLGEQATWERDAAHTTHPKDSEMSDHYEPPRVERDYDECPQCDDITECARAFDNGHAVQRCLACGHVQKWRYPIVRLEL